MAEDLYSLDSASLSHLSSQLQSLGYISRPLDLPQLFASTPASTSHLSSPSAILAHQAQLANEARAREQVVRCLWSMLGARMDASEGLETLAARERVGNYELERVKGMLSKEKKAREAAEKEREKEAAKAKTAVAALAKEQAHHKHAKEELIKARSALQMVKTQALHDQKRRETELSSTMTRLQRLTADPTQSKFVVLNPVAGSLTTSSARPSKSSLSSSRTPTPVSDSSVDQAEVTFLQEALDECETERRRFESENEGLRSLVGEVGEWTDGMLELKGVKGAEQDEAAKAMEDVGDESYLIPNPHLTLTVSELASPLYNKLYQIRVGVQALVDTTEQRVEAARAELADQLETERKEREDEEQRRSEAEKELEDAKQLIASSDQLVKDFASQRFLAGIAGETAADVSTEDAEEDLVRPVDSPAAAAKAKGASKPEDDRAALEAKRAKEVADFLGDLGLDSPVPAPGAKTLSSAAPAASAPLKVVTSAIASSSAPRPSKPSTSRPTSSSRRSKPVAHPLSPLVEETSTRSSSHGAAASVFDPPSPFLSAAPAPVVSKLNEVKPRSALAGIMAMADTPPSSRETLSSSVPAPAVAPARPPAAAPTPALKSKTSSNSLLEKSKARARDALLSREKEVRTTTKKTVTVSGSVRKMASSKENSAPRFGVKSGPSPSVF